MLPCRTRMAWAKGDLDTERSITDSPAIPMARTVCPSRRKTNSLPECSAEGHLRTSGKGYVHGSALRTKAPVRAPEWECKGAQTAKCDRKTPSVVFEK